jgi:hypothetical protein
LNNIVMSPADGRVLLAFKRHETGRKNFGSESRKDPRKRCGWRGDEKQLLLAGAGVVREGAPDQRSAKTGVLDRLGIIAAPPSRVAPVPAVIDLNHHVLLGATCRNKVAGPFVAPRGSRSRFWLVSVKSQGQGTS